MRHRGKVDPWTPGADQRDAKVEERAPIRDNSCEF